MTPGLAFFYGGLVKAKSVVSMLMLSFGAMGLIGVLWVIYGYGIADPSADSAWIPGWFGNPFEYLFLSSEEVYLDFEVITDAAFAATFAIITTALVSGAIADRAKFGSWLIFAGLWATLVYFPAFGWLFLGWIVDLGENLFPGLGLESEDWAGGTAVHINAGAAALALAIVLGKRAVFKKGEHKPHNVPLVLLGAALLWFGWFGFNTGAVGYDYGALAGGDFAGGPEADALAGLIFLNTIVTPAAAILGWLIVEKIKDGKPTSVGAGSGAVAGLVAITPACAFITPGWAILLGLLAGAISALAIDLKYKLGYDDSLDVVGLHLVAGFVGTLYIGFFGINGGLFTSEFGLEQLALQAIPSVVVAVYSFVVALIIGFAIEKTIGFRVTSEDELAGVDTVVHGETGYILAND